MGCAKDVESFAEPVLEIGGDIAAAVTGNPELIPLINAGVTTAGDLATGDSIGKSLGQGALAGGEALAGQEALGAVGVGEGNSTFNDALGITGDNPAGTGLPDIGADFNSAIGSVNDELGLSASSPNAAVALNSAGAPVDSAGTTIAAPSAPTSVAPSAGATIGAGQAANFSAGQVNSQISDSFNDIPGAQTASSPDLGSIGGTTVPSSSVGQAFSGNSVPGEVGPQASSAIGASSPASLATGQPDTLTGFGTGVGGANIPGAQDNFGGAFTPAANPPSSLLQTAEKTAVQSALPLGGLAYEAIKGPAKLPSSAQALEAGGAATAPLLALENQGATEASTGQLTAPQQANVLQYVQQSKDALLQQLASEGVTNPTKDSRYIQGLQQIQQQALALQQQYITGAISEATAAGGAASQNIAQASQEQIQNDTAFQDALGEAFGALGGSLGGVTVPQKAAA